MNSARSCVPPGTADTSGSAAGAICAEMISRACSAGARGVRDVALDARQPRAVVGDVEQPRLDLPARRLAAAAAGAAARRSAASPASDRRAMAYTVQPRNGRRRRRARCTPLDGGDIVIGPPPAKRVAEPDDGIVQALRERVLERVAREQLFPVPGSSDTPSRPAPPACSPIRARAAARRRAGRFASGIAVAHCCSSMPANAFD